MRETENDGCITRDADLSEIPRTCFNCGAYKYFIDSKVREIINNAPTIEPRRTDGRKCGEWIDREQCQVDEDGYDVAICSNCKEEITIDPRHDNYCPNCGADMKGADDE